MAEKCLRNASCKCSMCAGFDVASLVSITKSISSNIKYGDSEDDDRVHDSVAPLPNVGDVVHSPFVPSHTRTVVANSPPLPASTNSLSATAIVQNFSIPTATDDVVMADTEALQSSVTEKDLQMDTVAPLLSHMDIDCTAVTSGQASILSLDVILPKMTDKDWKVRKEEDSVHIKLSSVNLPPNFMVQRSSAPYSVTSPLTT